MHVAVEMVFVASTPPQRRFVRRRGTEPSKEASEELHRIENRKGILRCPVWKCGAVAAIEELNEYSQTNRKQLAALGGTK